MNLSSSALLQKGRNGDTASAIFYLKTQAGWRETDRMKQIVNGQVSALADACAALDAGQEDYNNITTIRLWETCRRWNSQRKQAWTNWPRRAIKLSPRTLQTLREVEETRGAGHAE